MKSAPETIRRLGLNPLNRIAALLLRKAGVKVREDALPVFQLMQWGVAEGAPLTHRRTAAELVRLTLLPDQGQALAYLVHGVPGGLPFLQQKLLKLPPRRAAEVLLDILDMRLKADPHNPYPEKQR